MFVQVSFIVLYQPQQQLLYNLCALLTTRKIIDVNEGFALGLHLMVIIVIALM